MGPKPTNQTKSRKEQILIMEKENDQSRKAEMIEEVVIIHVWPSGIKALPDTNSYF
jgi:hypothetical protein